MQGYELTIVMSGKTTPVKAKAQTEKVEKILNSLKGKMDKVTEWGKLDLAYEIKKEDSGVFLHYSLELEPAAVRALDQHVKMDENVVRYLLIKTK